MMEGDSSRTMRETTLEKDFLSIYKKYKTLLQASRNLFSLNVNIIEKT